MILQINLRFIIYNIFDVGDYNINRNEVDYFIFMHSHVLNNFTNKVLIRKQIKIEDKIIENILENYNFRKL